MPVSEIDRLIAERVAEHLAKSTAGASPADAAPWMEQLAMQFAILADQGTGRKRVAPEVMVQRARAHEDMEALIEAAKAAGEEPVYRLVSFVHLGEVKISPIWVDRDRNQQSTEIGWDGIPNEAMIPVNEPAKAIHEAFLTSIGAEKPREMGKIKVTAGGLNIIKGPPDVVAPERPHTGTQSGSRDGLQTATIRRGEGADRSIFNTVAPVHRG